MPGQRSDGSTGRFHRFWPFALCVGLAAGLRLVYAIQTAGVAWRRQPVGDARGYSEWAAEIARGNWLGSEPFYQAPLYPYLLALFSGPEGPSWGAVAAIQCCWGAAAAGLLCFATSRLFGRSAGTVAGLMLAAYAPAIFFDGIIQKTSLANLLVCVLLAVMAWKPRISAAAAAGLGAITGLSALARENLLLWAPILLLWVGVNGGARRVRVVGAYLLGVLVCLGPVAVRNRVVGGEWSLSTFQAGPNFYIGNHAGASGLYEPLVRGHETPAFERGDATQLAERALGRRLTAGQVSDYWLDRALADIKGDPVGWLRLVAHKVLLVWNRYEVADAESLYVYAAVSPLLATLNRFWHFGVVVPLAILGLAATWSKRRTLWIHYALILATAGSVAMFFVLARYRFTLVPLLMPFAAVGLTSVWSAVKERQYRRLAFWAVLAGAAAGIVNRPMLDERKLDAMAHMNLGVALAKEGDIEGAVRYFRLGVKGNPRSPEANNNLAMALAVGGAYEEAIHYYRAALATDPDLSGVRFNLGVALEHAGRKEEALKAYRRAVELDPLDREARAAVARLAGGG